jgi:hypothetical protein
MMRSGTEWPYASFSAYMKDVVTRMHCDDDYYRNDLRFRLE